MLLRRNTISTLFCALFLGLPHAHVVAAQETEPALRLFEVRALDIPDSGAVTGVAVTGSGAALVSYAGRPGLVLLRQGASAAHIGNLRLRAPIGLALMPGDSLLEAVDTAGSLVRRVRLRNAGDVTAEMRYRLPIQPANAAWAEGTWYAGGVDTEGGYRVYRLGDSGAVGEEIGRVAPGTGPMLAHLTVCGRTVLVTQRVVPFRATRIVPSTDPEDLETYSPPVPADSVAGVPLWVSAPTVCLGDGYLRTISDLRSDRRILVVYGADGRIVRTREVNAPLAVVSTVPGQSGLVALRRIGAPELVWYDWRWSGTHP